MVGPMCAAALSLVVQVSEPAARCSATCTVLETGPMASREIAAAHGPNRYSTRLLGTYGKVEGDSMDELRAQCEELGRGATWFKPTGDQVRPVLVEEDIRLVTVDGVTAVQSFQELTKCRPETDPLDAFLPGIGMTREGFK